MLSAIDAIVLAAGKSERFGQPKVLHSFLGEPFLTRIINNLRESGVRNVTLVLGYNAGEYIRQLPQSGFPFIVINQDYELGQFSSLQAGVQTINTDSKGVILTLVDCPHVSYSTYQRVVDAACSYPEKVIIPTHASRGGHPIFLPKVLLENIEEASPKDNLRNLFQQFPALIHRLEVDEPGVTKDIDTPEDLIELEREYQSEHLPPH